MKFGSIMSDQSKRICQSINKIIIFVMGFEFRSPALQECLGHQGSSKPLGSGRNNSEAKDLPGQQDTIYRGT